MREVEFNYEGNNTIIQCNENDKMKDIINKFLVKINIEDNDCNLIYLYNGTRINNELTLNQVANELDKNRRKMNILVTNSSDKHEIKELISKDIICSQCKENAFLDIKNFRIHIYGCKNNHEINNILLNRFKKTQLICQNEIKCDLCKINNKGNTHNNEFFICNTCNKNICPLCKSIHEKDHIVINYDDKNYICKIHNDSYIKYCKTCNENLCIICQNEHNNHETFELSEILFNRNDLIKSIKDLKEVIDKFKNKIEMIKEIFDKMMNLIDLYYSINNDIINNYNINKRNYYQLQNLYKLKNNNKLFIEKLNGMIDNDKIAELYDFSFNNFYNENGEKYIGKMRNGLKEGKGILYYDKDNKNKRKKYEGDFKNDKPNGKGTLYWIDGSKYEGDWKNDIKEGKGIMFYNNVGRYEGDWKNGKREGKGIYYWNNGDKYEGDWKNNIREGNGIYYYNDGKIEKGTWKNDKYLGK